jgi:hypothetical protein
MSQLDLARICLPLVLAYQTWSYYVFHRRTARRWVAPAAEADAVSTQPS